MNERIMICHKGEALFGLSFKVASPHLECDDEGKHLLFCDGVVELRSMKLPAVKSTWSAILHQYRT